MKNRIFTLIAFFFALQIKAQIGIGTTSPSPSSILDLSSTNKGLLIPRMTQAERNAISSPATGLLIYQTNLAPGFYYYNGASWQPIYLLLILTKC
ncbi:MAG: hypothetical protein KatS3mg035_0347 [Bacteroidia bacterium]|nr:MAG: hypothetical protein KatS3mg035_0347 [Bacteroidia bacterium]